MNPEARKLFEWIEFYEVKKDSRFTCKKCGISHPTLRKWLKRCY